ncbi:MAG: hypothetical protein JOZ39_02120, partial [Chloroflexi bacterium]|nr:hypothetical protein [Chloroflexota bacterium]
MELGLPPLGRVVLWLAVAVLVVFPAGELLSQSTALRPAAIAAAAPAIWNTIWASALATLMALLVGTGCALATERMPLPGRGLWRLAVLLPL